MSKKKAASGKDATTRTLSGKATLKPVRVPPEIKQKMLDSLSPRAKQARRLVEALANHPDAPTNRLNVGSGVNLSSVAKTYNPNFERFDYFIGCRRPPTPIKNKFGEDSSQHLWGFYRCLNADKRGKKCPE